jgi:uncharacterized membrane protein YkvI
MCSGAAIRVIGPVIHATGRPAICVSVRLPNFPRDGGFVMRTFQAIQIAFTFIGTIVGAGFATGQEVLQFFTRFGIWGTAGILLSSVLFVWIGARMMLASARIRAQSYESLNQALFGRRWGTWASRFMLVVLIGVNAVMLAGAGSIFKEHFGISYQTGLLVTIFLVFILLKRGMNAVLAVNSIVVPAMLLFTLIILWDTAHGPGADRWLTMRTDAPQLAAWASPLLYAAFNLSMAQAVLVPLGSRIKDRKTIIAGAWLGGVGIGAMLLVGHIALSARMPGIAQFDIPMGGIARELGSLLQWAYTFLIFAEIFTTLLCDIYGLTLQLSARLGWPEQAITAGLLAVCWAGSQIGFGPLLSTLYPLFGALSLGWLYQMMRRPGLSGM